MFDLASSVAMILSCGTRIMVDAPAKIRPLVIALSVAGAILVVALAVGVYRSRFAMADSSPGIAVGRRLPKATLKDEEGNTVELSSLLGQPLLLVLYRGAWCPSCRAQLTAFLPEVERFRAAGVKIVGISPDPPEMSAHWSHDLGLPFPLLSDEPQRLAADLCGTSAHCQLLIDKEGTIRWGALTENWQITATPSMVLHAALRLR
jgi:peroxiredoxin